MITRGLVWRLGLSQLVCWGISYYQVAIFGPRIATETGWPGSVVFGGFSLALVTMGIVSPAVGRAVDRRGGRVVMTAGSCLIAAGCALMAAATGPELYFAAWLVLGIAMRMSLYDAAFASLVRIGGAAARAPISQITLLGGLASSALWPIGEALANAFGWRAALLCYAGLALATVPLHLGIPAARHDEPGDGAGRAAERPPLARTTAEQRLAALLFALVTALGGVLNAAISAHVIALLTGLGLAAAAAVWASTLRGVGQSLARLGEILSGSRLDPLALGVLATGIVPLGLLAAVLGGGSVAAGIAFAFLYGAGWGLVTITRGTQPLVLFDRAGYGAISGRLVAPSFYLSALAPMAFAAFMDRYGPDAAIRLATALSLAVFAASAALWWRFGRPG